MNQLSELEAAAESLPTEHKRELVQLLLSRLRDEGVVTDFRRFYEPFLKIEPLGLASP
jgi:hypothetical protein